MIVRSLLAVLYATKRECASELLTNESFQGAAAVLEFYAIESPLAQPRNAVLSQVFASIIGVAVRKLFELRAQSRDLMWLGGSLSCAATTAVMALTGTVHPPAGATALLAVVDNGVADLGWFLLPVILLGCTLMQCVALLLNNAQRRFPLYWWSPGKVGQAWKRSPNSADDIEKSPNKRTASSVACDASHREHGDTSSFEGLSPQLIINRSKVEVPSDMYLTPEEMQLLEALRDRL